AFRRVFVEPPNGVLEFISRNVDLACEVGDGGATNDGGALDQLLRHPAFLQRIGAGYVPAHVTLVEDHPARHRLVGVHRLAHLDVGVRLVAELAAGPPSAMKTDGSHQASSSRSVLAPMCIAVCSTSPVSPGFAIDHLPSFG